MDFGVHLREDGDLDLLEALAREVRDLDGSHHGWVVGFGPSSSRRRR
ncbi:MAG: hypothetical protein M3Q68_07695 [Actinomycetota bacterium]|nr:hypothetical protein [Actinomycetota bacterium]